MLMKANEETKLTFCSGFFEMRVRSSILMGLVY